MVGIERPIKQCWTKPPAGRKESGNPNDTSILQNLLVGDGDPKVQITIAGRHQQNTVKLGRCCDCFIKFWV